MKIAIGSDHAGFELKEFIKEYLLDKGLSLKDFGAYSEEPVDYPDIAIPLAKAVGAGRFSRGILICGTGVGVSVAANRVAGVRAVNAADVWTAKQSREHGDSNILCLGGRVLSKRRAITILEAWLKTPFSGEERHRRRLRLIDLVPAAINARHSYYIDTSVPNYLFAERNLDHVRATRAFFDIVRRKKIKAVISTVVVEEISRAPVNKKNKLFNLIRKIKELDLDLKAEKLARAYVKNNVVPAKYFNDALHLAIATVNRIDCLVSWNFKHLINVKAKEKVNHLNYKYGYGYLDLISPEEVLA